MPVNMAEKRVFAKFAKSQRKALEVVIAEFLVGKSDDFMLQPNSAQFARQIGGNILRQINTGYESAANGVGLLNL